MEPGFALKVLTLVRLVCWMVLIYLGLGYVVEGRSRKPDSQLKGFFRMLCSPVAKPVARFLAPGTSHQRVLFVAMSLFGTLWIASAVADGAVDPHDVSGLLLVLVWFAFVLVAGARRPG